MLPIFYGIASAATWGAADFIGGLASKRTSPYRVLFLSECAGFVPFLILALVTREPIPDASRFGLGGVGESGRFGWADLVISLPGRWTDDHRRAGLGFVRGVDSRGIRILFLGRALA